MGFPGRGADLGYDPDEEPMSAREELARIIDEADNRWQHGIGASGYDPDGPPLWIADAILESGFLERREASNGEVEDVRGRD